MYSKQFRETTKVTVVLNQCLEEIHTFSFFFLTTVYLVPKAVDKTMFPNLLTQLSISGCVIFSLSKLSNCFSRSCIVFIFKLFKTLLLMVESEETQILVNSLVKTVVLLIMYDMDVLEFSKLYSDVHSPISLSILFPY
jgi:hypothetical protein